jgi:hypothetical protein
MEHDSMHESLTGEIKLLESRFPVTLAISSARESFLSEPRGN